MEILVTILTAAVIWNCVVTEKLVREFRSRMTQIEKNILHTTQARIASFFSDSPAPRIDAKARTVKRDTSDIPARGARMTTLTRKRKADDSIASDRRLPDDA